MTDIDQWLLDLQDSRERFMFQGGSEYANDIAMAFESLRQQRDELLAALGLALIRLKAANKHISCEEEIEAAEAVITNATHIADAGKMVSPTINISKIDTN